MNRNINSVAVIGAGTMGAGIAALAADKGCKVLLLDISEELVNKGKSRIINEKNPMLSNLENIKNIEIGTFEDDFHKIESYDWICEAVIEKLEIKKDIFLKIESFRKDGSIVSSNTSGIPLKEITKNMPDRLLKDICITHFFNPVKIMKLCELIPGNDTKKEIIDSLNSFLSNVLCKGVVNAKDTVNFIGNRIGCFFMLKGLYEGQEARANGLKLEVLDNIISKPFGIPPTGLYGLIDLIGLDVMDSVGKNLKVNLPKDDLGLKYVNLPEAENILLKNGQLGRKTGGGFYRLRKIGENKLKEVYDLEKEEWRKFEKQSVNNNKNVIFEDSLEGEFTWKVIGSTLLYAADLIPQISDNIINIDRAMRWGFAWQKGPFEMLDDLDPFKIIERCNKKGLKIPKMLEKLNSSGYKKFYDNGKFFSDIGKYENIDS